MRRIPTLLCLTSVVAVVVGVNIVAPRGVFAGGSEFPASGVRSLGRGGSGFTRADDPTVMLRNPALLADLWEDMAYSGVHILLPKSCFQATGNYGWATIPPEAANFGNGPMLITPANATTPGGDPLPNIRDEAFPEVCYDGPLPILPNIALSMKLAPNFGVGLGFFPPDNAQLAQYGNRDGTVDTPNGLRPSPARWFRAHLNVSYFSALAAAGYRPLSWLRVGFGFQWALVVYSATEFTRFAQSRNVGDDIRVDVSGRDLFIPGLIGSVHMTPIDSLDIAIGFKWSDRVKSDAKLDITTNYFGAGAPFHYVSSSGAESVATGLLPQTSHNRIGTVDSPPLWVPQLSFGLRYADRLAPKPTNEEWAAAKRAAGRKVQDPMSTERWDIEVNAVVYFNGATDVSRFLNANQRVDTVFVDDSGRRLPGVNTTVGQCIGDPKVCTMREVPRYMHGKTQYSFRLGGEYNVLPGVLAVRAGLSYETNGQDPRYLNITNYQLGRTGLHVGATWRVSDKTDISVAYAHFIQRDVRLRVNAAKPFNTEDPKRYHVVQGDDDGEAGWAIPDAQDVVEGPLFANAGTFYYNLDVVSVALAQHF